MWRKLLSRKLWLTILVSLCVVLNEQLGLKIPSQIQGQLLVIVVIIYITVEGIKDMIDASKGRK